MRFSALILVPFLALSLTTSHAASLPDTGQEKCYNGVSMVLCTSANTGDTATYPRQDGRFGRDAKATVGTLVKVGGGAAGFDYSKIANNGSDLGAGVGLALGTNSTDWACTRDNITGLTWEVKTSTNTDLRYSGHSYSWYSTNASTNGGNIGGIIGSIGNSCNATLPLSRCNTEAFITAVNTAALCNYNDWRMPTRLELLTLVHAGTSSTSIDATYFPNTSAVLFWSGSTYVSNRSIAWSVHFGDGLTNPSFKTNNDYLRLVRGVPF